MDLISIAIANKNKGDGNGTPQKQADWNQNDSSKKDYIKNRTHWKEEGEVDYTFLPYVEPIQGLGLAPYGKKLGLQIGQTYTIEAELEGQVYSFTSTATEIPKEILGSVIPGVAFLFCKEFDLQVVDGIEGDFSTSTITGTDNCYYNFFNRINKIKIQGNGIIDTDIITHKIPSEYLPSMPIANDYIETRMLKDGSVTEKKLNIADQSINGTKLVNASISEEKIKDRAISGQKILSNCIDYTKLMGPRLIIENKVTTPEAIVSFSQASSNTFYIQGWINSTDLENKTQTLVITLDGGTHIHQIELPITWTKSRSTFIIIVQSFGNGAIVHAVSSDPNNENQHCIDTVIYDFGIIRLRLGDSATQQFDVGSEFRLYSVTTG